MVPPDARAPTARRARAASRASRLTRPALRVLLALGGAFALVLLLAVLERLVWSGGVLPGVRIDGTSIAGWSERDAHAELSALAVELETAPVSARAGRVSLQADPSLFELDVDEDATLRAARRAGRSRNPLDAALGVVLRRVRHDDVALRVHVSDAGIDGVLDGWAAEVTEGTVEGGLRFDGTTVVEIEPVAGTGIRRGEARARLAALLHGADRELLDLPVGRVPPAVDRSEVARAAAQARALLQDPVEIVSGTETLTLPPEGLAATLQTRVVGHSLELVVDVDRLRLVLGPGLAGLETPSVDARFEVTSAGTVAVVPSVTGRQVDLEAVADAILRGERRISAPLRAVSPERDTAWAEALGITELVSSFTTRHPAGQPRVTNIHRAADLLDGTVVEPGEVFSLNETVGPRTEERGFVRAPVYYGEFTEDVGGGVSQLATTVFNAVFFGGYEDVYHKPHSIYFSRYPMGREATVNYPGLDLKFRNDSSHGVLVRATYSATSITVSFFGDGEGAVVRAEGPNVLAERPPAVEYVDWPLLPLGEEEELESGYTGYDVEVFRVIERPGQEPVRERFFWRYKMLPRTVLRGTAIPTTTTTSAATTTSSSPTSTSAPATTSSTAAP